MRSRASDAGTAAIEFIFATVILLIPLVYIVLSISTVQAGTYATQAIAIDAARLASRYPDSAENRAEATAILHLDDFGLSEVTHSIVFDCSETCSTPGETVTATVEARVPIPGLPRLFTDSDAGRITVRATHTDVVAPITGGSE